MTPPLERAVQRAILSMAARCFPDVLMHHSPNGAHLSGDRRGRAMQAGALRKDGQVAGFPDLIAFWDRGVVLMEVKRPGYTPSDVRPDQVAVHARLTGLGWPVAIVTSSDEAWAVLSAAGAPCRGRVG